MARTTASVGEALVAGAIFTIPAFVISGVWDELRYWESTAIMLVGGILGVLFIIVLRRTLVVEAELPYPESVAAAELVKAGQGGRQTGAKFVFQAMGVAGGLGAAEEQQRHQAGGRLGHVVRLARTVDHRDAGPAGELRGRVPAAVARRIAGAARRGLHRRAADCRHVVRRGGARLVAAGPVESLPEPGAGRRGDRFGRVHRAQHRGVAAASPPARRRDDDRRGVLHAVQPAHVAHPGHRARPGRHRLLAGGRRRPPGHRHRLPEDASRNRGAGGAPVRPLLVLQREHRRRHPADHHDGHPRVPVRRRWPATWSACSAARTTRSAV